MTITTITINSVNYISYASVAEADDYLAVDPTRATAWASLTTDQKGTNLVAATRRLDILNWQGEKTGGVTQENAWPRTGVTYADGTPTSTTDVPLEVQDATILIAGDIATTGASAAEAGSSGSNIKRAKAGSAEVQFFAPQSGVPLQNTTAYDFIAQFLGTGDASLFGTISGTDNNATSSFTNSDEFGRTEGFS